MHFPFRRALTRPVVGAGIGVTLVATSVFAGAAVSLARSAEPTAPSVTTANASAAVCEPGFTPSLASAGRGETTVSLPYALDYRAGSPSSPRGSGVEPVHDRLHRHRLLPGRQGVGPLRHGLDRRRSGRSVGAVRWCLRCRPRPRLGARRFGGWRVPRDHHLREAGVRDADRRHGSRLQRGEHDARRVRRAHRRDRHPADEHRAGLAHDDPRTRTGPGARREHRLRRGRGRGRRRRGEHLHERPLRSDQRLERVGVLRVRLGPSGPAHRDDLQTEERRRLLVRPAERPPGVRAAERLRVRRAPGRPGPR